MDIKFQDLVQALFCAVLSLEVQNKLDSCPRAPLFTRAEDPLNVDVWLRVVESKLPFLTGACPNASKTCFATQQLRGPARKWWDHFLAMQPADHMVTWDEFKAAF
jgi:hypothetical protein